MNLVKPKANFNIGLKTATGIKQKILVAIGIFFIAFGTLAMDYAIFRGQPSWILWSCYIGLIIIGLGALLQKGYLIASQLNILTLPLILWQIDFISYLFFDQYLFGLSQYFFSLELLPLARFISLEHFFLLPLAFITLRLVGLDWRHSWQISLSQLIVSAFLLYIFTDGSQNINCVFRPCLTFVSNSPWYFMKWLIIASAMIIGTNWLLNRLFYRPK